MFLKEKKEREKKKSACLIPLTDWEVPARTGIEEVSDRSKTNADQVLDRGGGRGGWVMLCCYGN